ncbi:MAG: hypothetical protein LBB88_09860 [Planctomycetaceae bacterium]|nr:hypothetical protein [Planctomycetaceae bacterium]
MSNPFYRCLRQRDLSAKGRLPDLLLPTDGQLLRNMSYRNSSFVLLHVG